MGSRVREACRVVLMGLVFSLFLLGGLAIGILAAYGAIALALQAEQALHVPIFGN